MVSIDLPVLTRELRCRLRGTRGPLLLFIPTVLAIAVAVAIIGVCYHLLSGSLAEKQTQVAQIGQYLAIGLYCIEGFVCFFITPALTAGAITKEREQQTLEFLFLTRLTSHDILFGKLLSSLGLVILLIFCTLPVIALSFLFGGVSAGEVIYGLVSLLSSVVLYGVIGLLASLLARKTSVAIMLSYLCCMVISQAVGFAVVFTVMLIGGRIESNQLVDTYIMATAIIGSIYNIIFSALLYWLSVRKLDQIRRSVT